MITTDRTYAAHLINAGYIMNKPVDYSKPQWEYSFNISEIDNNIELETYRKHNLCSFQKICVALALGGKSTPIKGPILDQWPTLHLCERK